MRINLPKFGTNFSVFLTCLTLVQTHCHAEGTTSKFEIGGQAGSSVIFAPTTAVYVALPLGFYLVGGIQFSFFPSLTYTNDNNGNSALTLGVPFGPTINFTFNDSIQDSVFLFLGTSVNHNAVVTASTAAATYLDFGYEIDFGKRFALTANLTLKPAFRVAGSLSQPAGPIYSIVPLACSLLF